MLHERHVRFYLVNAGIHFCEFDNCDSGQNHIYQRSEYSQQQRPLSFLMVEYPPLKMRQFSRHREESCIGHFWISFLNIVRSSGKGCEFRILFLISIDVGTPPRDWHLNMSDFQFHE